MPESGRVIEGNGVSGALCLATPWPGQSRTVWGDHQRFKETYFGQYRGLYFTGDGCRRDEDGYYWITGRIDDVLNVSGHRLGTAEVESHRRVRHPRRHSCGAGTAEDPQREDHAPHPAQDRRRRVRRPR